MINAYLNETITLIRAGKPGDYMEPTEPELIDVKARVNWINELIRNQEGEQVVSAVNVLIKPDEEVYFDDRFKIHEIGYSILKIDKRQDFSARYLKIWLG